MQYHRSDRRVFDDNDLERGHVRGPIHVFSLLRGKNRWPISLLLVGNFEIRDFSSFCEEKIFLLKIFKVSWPNLRNCFANKNEKKLRDFLSKREITKKSHHKKNATKLRSLSYKPLKNVRFTKHYVRPHHWPILILYEILGQQNKA